MGDWYLIGLLVGLGVAFGILAAAVVPRWLAAAVVAAAAGVVVGFLVDNWDEALGGLAGGIAGAIGAAPGGNAGRARALRRPRRARRRRACLRAGRRLPRGRRAAGTRSAAPLACPGAPRRAPHARTRLSVPKPVVLVVIDGLTPSMLESADTPALRFLLEHGEYRRAASTFPSLTPVCLASIATGAHPDVHGIPHLVWWHRDEQRIVEYGSSFGAILAAGLARSLRDTIIDLNARHLSQDAETIYEALEDAGLTTAAINITCYRGRNRHLSSIPGLPAVYGPKRFFWYSLY